MSVVYDERTARITEAAVGPDHPRFGSELGNLCNTHILLHDYARAMRRLLPRARHLSSGPRRGQPACRVPLLRALGEAQLDPGHPERALPRLERALAIRTAKAPDPMEMGETELVLFARARRATKGGREAGAGARREGAATLSRPGERTQERASRRQRAFLRAP